MAFQQDLAHEFPEMKDAIHTLKISDKHFKHLFDRYEAVAKELHRASNGATLDDAHAEDLKKKRLELKDELYAMLKKASGGGCGSSSYSSDKSRAAH